MRQVPFTVIGGFLGAGKTTLLNRLLSQSAGTRFAVLVNDFGRLNIDATLIASRNSRTLSLTNGCMCCSIADGFTRVLSDLLEQLDEIDHIVVEASGVSQPQRIIDIASLEPGLLADGVVVMVDAAAVRQHALDRYVGDVVTEQLRSAHLHIVNKVDLVCADELKQLHSWLRTLCARVPAIECSFANIPLPLAIGSALTPLAVSASADNGAGETFSDTLSAASMFRTCTLTGNVCPRREEFLAAADLLPASVIRGKGLVRFRASPDEIYLWQMVGASKSLMRVMVPGVETCQLVLIGTPRMPPAHELALAQLFDD